MTTTAASSSAPTGDRDTPSLGQLLAASALSPRQRAAVQALVEEKKVIALDNVHAALVAKEDGVMTCRWQRLSARFYTLGLDEEERAFLGLVLSLVGVRQVHLAAVEHLDERRLKIILQAVVRLADNDRIAIGTRL